MYCGGTMVLNNYYMPWHLHGIEKYFKKYQSVCVYFIDESLTGGNGYQWYIFRVVGVNNRAYT